MFTVQLAVLLALPLQGQMYLHHGDPPNMRKEDNEGDLLCIAALPCACTRSLSPHRYRTYMSKCFMHNRPQRYQQTDEGRADFIGIQHCVISS